jgi:hypothetical protein
VRARVLALILCAAAALAAGPATAGLGETLPKLFLDVVNKAIKGSIQPETIRYKAPTSLLLENARLLAPGGEEVARVRRAEINVAVSELFVGNITIEKLDVEGALLKLVRRDGELNLVRALKPVKPSDGGKSSLKVKLDGITLTGGDFRYDDAENNVNIEARSITAGASVSVDLKTDTVKVDATRVRVRSGVVKLKKLDIPLRDVRLSRFKQRDLRLDLIGGTGRALGDASFSVDGQIRVNDAGRLSLGGIVRTPRGAWPDRLKKLAFETPDLDGTYRVTGPLRDPTVEVDANLGRLADAYGMRATRGSARLLVDKRKVVIQRAALALGTGAADNVTAVGSYTIDDEQLALDVNVRGAPLSELVRRAELSEPPRGAVHGSARVTGKADGDAPLTIVPDLSLRGARGFSITLPETRVTGRIFASSSRVDLAEARARGAGIDLQTKGYIDLDNERIDLDLTLEGRDLQRRIPDLPEDIVIGATSARGAVKGPYKNPLVTARVTIATADAYGVPITNAKTTVAATKSRTVLSDLTATVSGGALTGELELDTRQKTRIAGALALEDGDLALLKVTDEPLPVTGKVARLAARLSGPAKTPVIEIDVVTRALEAEGERLGVARARGLVTRDDLTLSAFTLSGGVANVRGLTPIWFGFDEKAVAGRAIVELPDLARVKAAGGHARGRVAGEILLGGTVDAPDVRALLEGSDLVARGVELGRAEAVLRALPDDVEGRAAQLTAKVNGPAGSLDVRAAYALDRERLHAVVRVIEADLAPWLKQIPETVAPLQGIVSGRIVVKGDPRAPDAELSLRIPELAMPAIVEGDSTADEMRRLRALGPLTVSGTLEDDRLDATLCAAPSSLKRPAGPCGDGFPVWLSASGPLDLKKEYLDLEVALGVAHDDVQELVIPLRELGMKLDAALSGLGRVRWQYKEEDTPRVTGRYTVEGATLEMEGAPRIELLRPARIAVARNKVTLIDEIRFSAGEGTLRVAGSASADEIDLTLRGDVGTPLLKLYTDEVTVARGEVRADLTVTGEPSALRLSGSLTPKPDAAVGLRSLRQTIVLDGGRVLFTLEGGGQRVHIDKANPLKASLGDGDASLHGDVAFSFPDEGDRPVRFDQWDVHLTANDLFVRSGTTFVEANARLELVGPREAPVLKGTVDVSDGSIRESFDLRNFVLESARDEPSKPLNERLAVVDLDQLRLDLTATVRSFRGRAEIGTFPLDLTTTGDLRATGTLEVPKLSGALEVVSGDLVLPRARFEVLTARFEWSPERPGLVPRIFLSAMADLPPQGTCDVDIPVELTLQGDDLDRIDLGLSAADSGAAHTRSDLLKAVLAGVSLPACSDDPSGDLGAAWRALLSPVSTQVSREIEALLAGSVGGDFTINPFFDGQRIATDVRWDLGRRVQLEGETGIRAGRELVTDEDIPIAGADVRMRLLLWDPFLFGKELFLEGELTSEQDSVELTTRIETRLKWRIFER